MERAYVKNAAFTIVELLVAIVVVGILAAVSVVAYGNLSSRADVAAAQTAAKQAASRLATYLAEHGAPPSSLQSIGIADSATTSYQYAFGASATPSAWCVTTTVRVVSFYVSDTVSTPQKGGCPGHGQGGVAAVTNLTHPGKIASRGTVTGFNKTNVMFNSEQWSAEAVPAITGHGLRISFDAASGEVTNESYTSAVEIANPNEVAIDVSIDVGDAQFAGATIPVGSTTVLSVVGARNWDTGGTNYRFLDVNIGTASINRKIIIRRPTVLRGNLGTIGVYDGNSPNWAWSGAPYASASTGPMP